MKNVNYGKAESILHIYFLFFGFLKKLESLSKDIVFMMSFFLPIRLGLQDAVSQH